MAGIEGSRRVLSWRRRWVGHGRLMSTPLFERNMDLVREILIWAEHGGAPGKRPRADEIALGYHIEIMVQADLIDGIGKIHRVPSTGEWEPMLAVVKKPTWRGQEFLEAVRNETVWNQAKAKAKEHGIPALFDVLKAIALGIVAKGLP
jgi:hypothetical protein